MKILNHLLITCLALIVVSCAGKKFDYQSAYKFTSPSKKHVEINSNLQEKNLLTDTRSINLAQNDLNPAVNISAKAEEEGSKLKSVSKRDELLSNLNKKERKIFSRIEKKIERKLEAKPAASKSVNAKVYTGVIVGAAGLVLMILTSGTLGAIGGIALLVGLIFIVWGLLE